MQIERKVERWEGRKEGRNKERKVDRKEGRKEGRMKEGEER